MRIINIIISLFISNIFFSCKDSDFLDAKPDRSLLVPTSIAELQSLLNNETVINAAHSIFGEIAADNYYLSENFLNSTTESFYVKLYTYNDDIWPRGVGWPDWKFQYRAIFYTNAVLEGLSKLHPSETEFTEYNNVKGSGLFHRANMSYQLLQIFGEPYDQTKASSSLGIPVRLSSDINEPINRSSVLQSYNQVLKDLKEAVTYLPVTPLAKTHPSLPAAYGLLARVYLTMQSYDSALVYANKCLELKGDLMDYNDFDVNSAGFPFPKYNTEVMYHEEFPWHVMLHPTYANIDTSLFESYNDNDLRKQLYFLKKADNIYSFKGSYGNQNGNALFGGIATDEIYLISAECYARTGDITKSMDKINQLMQKRWDNSVTYPTFTAINKEDAISKILTERRKELLMRGLRWTDIRRLNKEGANISITKKLNNQLYTITPNSPKFTFLIPQDVMDFNPDMPQNPR